VLVEDLARVGGVLERSRSEAMAEREFRAAPEIVFENLSAAVERGESSTSSGRCDVPTVALDAGIATALGDRCEILGRKGHVVEQFACPVQASSRSGRALAPRVAPIRRGVTALPMFAVAAGGSAANGPVPECPLDDRDALVDVLTTGDRRRQREAITQLGSEVALLGIHRADERERSGVSEADSVAFDPIDAARGRVEQHVDEVVVEQIYLVDVQEPAIGAGEQPGVELVLSLERVGHRERPGHLLAGRSERQCHERDRPLGDRRVGGW
jgi:hypothetical protein